MKSGFHSKRKTYFRLLLIVSLLAIGVFVFLQVSMFFTQQRITDQNLVLAKQNEELAGYKNLSGYITLNAIKQLEEKNNTMPWADRINKIIEMLTELKSLTPTNNETIVLSDFKVSLDSISLRGKVSSLLLLYYSSPTKNIVSLIDRFKQLDFIKDIQIKSYNRGADNTFDFVLEAKVTDNGNK